MSATNIDFPWKRRMRLEISGLQSGNSESSKTSRKYECDGTQNKLRIVATVSKQMGLADPTQIMLWNLNANTRMGFQRKETKLRLFAGWDSGPLKGLYQVFYGELLNSQTRRENADLVTTLFALSIADQMPTAVISKTWIAGTAISEIVRYLGEILCGTTGNLSIIKDIPGTVGYSGLALFGSAREQLTFLSKEYGFNWTINDNVFIACGGNTLLDNVRDVNYLINVSPIMVSSEQETQGISWTSLFDPHIQILQGARIKSSIADTQKRYGGKYRVNALVHSLDCYSQYVTQGTAFFLPGLSGNNG